MSGYEIGSLWVCLKTTAIPFLVSSSIILVTGASLATLETVFPNRRSVTLLILAHLLPLFMAPVLLVQVTVKWFESFSMYWTQSIWTLAFFGYVFHTFLCYLVLTQIFGWSGRLDRVKRLTFNLQRRNHARLIIRFMELAPPLFVSFTIMFIFQESMLSAPFFVRCHTVISLAWEAIGDSVANAGGALIALSILATILLCLLISYIIPDVFGQVLLKIICSRKPSRAPRCVEAIPPTPDATRRSVNRLFAAVATISALANFAIFFLTCFRICLMGRDAPLAKSATVIDTMLSPAIRCGIFAFAFFIIWIVRRRLRTTSRLTPFPISNGLAFIPPSILGTLGLLFVFGNRSKLAVAYVLLFSYAFVLIRFFAGQSELVSHYVLLHNAKTMSLSFGRRNVVRIVSAVGAMLWPGLFAFYFLWIEDGIQVTILGNTPNLAHLVRGLRMSGLDNSVYQGALMCFLLWLGMGVLTFIMTRVRFRVVHIAAPWRVVKASMVLLLFFVVSPGHAAAKGPLDSIHPSRESCFYPQVRLSGETVVSIGGTRCRSVVVNLLTVDNAVGYLQLVAPNANVTVKELRLTRGGAVLHVDGGLRKEVKGLEIDSIVSEGILQETARLQLENIKLVRLAIRGHRNSVLGQQENGGNGVAIVMGEFAEAADIDIHSLYCPELSLRLAAGKDDSVHLDDVTAKAAQIMSATPIDEQSTFDLQKEALPSAMLDLHLTLRGTREEPAKLTIRDLTITSLRVDIYNTGSASRSEVKVENTRIQLDTDIAPIRVEGENAGVDAYFENIILAGTLSFFTNTSAPDELTVWRLKPEARPLYQAALSISGAHLSRLILKQIELDDFTMCSCSMTPNYQLRVSDFAVSDEVSVPREVLRDAFRADSRPFERARFFQVLQEHGEYCGSTRPIGTDALYFRKKLEMASVHPTLAWLIDCLTGLGVNINKALVTLFLIILVHFMFRVLLFTISEWKTHVPPESSFRTKIPRILYEASIGTFASRELRTHDGWLGTWLATLRVVFGGIIFIQITLCSIYLSQTTLR